MLRGATAAQLLKSSRALATSAAELHRKNMGKFSIEKAVGAGKQEDKKRALDIQPQQTPRSNKMLKASSVVIEDGPSPQKTTFRKLAANAPVEVVIRKYRCVF